jgi:hypothetical protein
MKKAFLIVIVMVAVTSVFSSCKKQYNCECTDPTGGVTYHTVNATNKVEAATNCNKISQVKECVLK